MKFKLLLFICILLVLSSFVFAVKTITTNPGEGGLTLRTTPYEFIQLNQDFHLHLHVFNSSNGVPLDNKTIQCYLHLYNHSGSHTFTGRFTTFDDMFDFELPLTGGNFSQLGVHAYILQCNGTNKGGFESSTYTVTNDGFTNVKLDSTSGISISLFMFLIIGGLFALGLKFEFSENIITQLILRRCCFVIGIWMMTYTTTIMMTIADAASLPLLGEMKTLMFIFGWAGYSAMVYLVVKTVFDVVKNYNNMMLNKRMSDD